MDVLIANYLHTCKKKRKFASTNSATLPVEQRTRAELLFLDGARFENAVALYNFDRELRLLLFKEIQSIGFL